MNEDDVAVIKHGLSAGHYRFTEHALEQMLKRQLSEADVAIILAASEDVSLVRDGRVVVLGLMGSYLLRVFVDVDRSPMEVVTVYRTSKIDRYRSRS